jgi:hypothetical protein
MKFVLHCIGEGMVIECITMDEVWSYARDNGLCAEEIYDDELPPRRILNPRYEIHTFASDGELVAMSRIRLADPPLKEWESEWPDT